MRMTETGLLPPAGVVAFEMKKMRGMAMAREAT
jgi:hypothetical protein